VSFEFIVGLSHSESENENEKERKREREAEKIRRIRDYRIAIIIGDGASVISG